MKKIFSFILILSFGITFISCGNSSNYSLSSIESNNSIEQSESESEIESDVNIASVELKYYFNSTELEKTINFSIELPQNWTLTNRDIAMIYSSDSISSPVGQIEVYPKNSSIWSMDQIEELNPTETSNFTVSGYPVQYYLIPVPAEGTNSLVNQYFYFVELENEYILFLFYDNPNEEVIFTPDTFQTIVSSMKIV